MAAYYNEIDPFAARWLRDLIAKGRIAPGDVDERSIVDVTGADLVGYKQVHLFAGIGGWSLALRLAGIDDDVPVWTGSCPCQPFSALNQQRDTDARRALWDSMYLLVADKRPSVVFGEQVAGRAGLRWLSGVRNDLERAGYAVGAADLCAAAVGAPHIRQRIFWGAIRADTRGDGIQGGGASGVPRERGPWGQSCPTSVLDLSSDPFDEDHSNGRPPILAVAHGIPARVGRQRGYGNAIVPQLAANFVTAYLKTAESIW